MHCMRLEASARRCNRRTLRDMKDLDKIKILQDELLKLMYLELTGEGMFGNLITCRWCGCWIKEAESPFVSKRRPHVFQEAHRKGCFAIEMLGRPAGAWHYDPTKD